MTSYLCISVTFLDPLYHGRLNGDRTAEWPPSPLRLYQALLAGARGGCRNCDWSDTSADAFRWLERRDPPEIVAPIAQPLPSYTLYVPNNDGDRQSDRQLRLASKAVRPHRLVNGETLYYLWPLEEKDLNDGKVRTAIDVLRRESRHLLALGWGIDMVVGDGRILSAIQARSLPGERWRPWPEHHSSRAARRVPAPGTLDDLEQVYATFLARIHGKLYSRPRPPSVFRLVSYLRSTDLPPRPWVLFDLCDEQGSRRSFRQTDAVLVAAMLRHCACEVVKRDPHDFEGGSEVYVAGHVAGCKTLLRDSPICPCQRSVIPMPMA